MVGGSIIKKTADTGKDDKSEAGDAIPREPEKMKLKGHRSKITKIAFHPVYT